MITLDDIRRELTPRWEYALPVVDAIEERARLWPAYSRSVNEWLSGKESTVYFRDYIMAQIRHLPQIIEIGKQFNPTTEWHNTWMPLDTAMHLAKQAKLVPPEDGHAEMTALPYFGMF